MHCAPHAFPFSPPLLSGWPLIRVDSALESLGPTGLMSPPSHRASFLFPRVGKAPKTFSGHDSTTPLLCNFHSLLQQPFAVTGAPTPASHGPSRDAVRTVLDRDAGLFTASASVLVRYGDTDQGLINTGTHFSDAWKPGSPASRREQVQGRGRASWLVMTTPALSPPRLKEQGALRVSFMRAPVPVTFRRPHLRIPSRWG